MESEGIGIHSLPDEIIIMIMKWSSYSDCNSFMRTCKRYNDILKSSHSLWRVIYKKTAGKVMYNITAAHSEGNWISDVRQYLSLREYLIDLIVAMSANHFRITKDNCGDPATIPELIIPLDQKVIQPRTYLMPVAILCFLSSYLEPNQSDANGDCGLENVKDIFAIALSGNTNYYLTVSIIQNHIREANRKINTYETKSPYTLTEVYYGKMILRYLMHVVLALKWAQNEATNLLTPEIVLNFFIQWIDPLNMHSDEEVRELIKEMICDVETALLLTRDGVPLPDVKKNSTVLNGSYTEREVLLAISYYMYKQRRMALMTAFNEDTLDVVKTIKSNSGHAICLGAIFEAIARGFGITSCKLVAFSNHAYVEWRCNSGFQSEMMKFSLDTGELSAMGSCPFSRNQEPNRVPYYADTFADYIANSYVDYMGIFRNWRSNNASHFLHFITNRNVSEYCNFILYVRGLDSNKLAIPFNMEYIHEEHINCIHALLALNKTPAPKTLQLSVNHRVSKVMYCVGLICFNKVHDYVCVIRHWDKQIDPSVRTSLDDPRQSDQPYYKVIAMDQTERYISQENLMVVSSPSRLYHLEEVLGKEFSHFNGFFYVPNREKQMLFPDDLGVGNAYASQRKLIPEKVRLY